MTAFLSEDAEFPAVPRLAGYAEVVAQSGEPTTVAMLEEFVADGADAFESIAGMLVGWLTSAGDVSLEFATEIAADLGTLTAGLHAAVADGRGIPEMAPRDATRKEIRSWAQAAQQHLESALGLATGEAAAVLHHLAQRIAESITVIDALPTAPEVIRAHGDYHLGQVLIAQDGFRIVDFEGEPLASAEARRAHRPALRDVASMLRSIDHVARSAGRRAEAANGGPLERAGLDLDAWIDRARERFLGAYRAGLLERRVWADIDPDLLHAFEVDKELYEVAYAATYLPSWLYAPIGGMRALFADRAAA
jgi:maltose alpha-D-glucosyltransferase/alpha-amylase